MIKRNTARICLFCVLASMVMGVVQAATRMISERPTGQPLWTGGAPWLPPGMGNAAPRAARVPMPYGRATPSMPPAPRLEVQAADASPYVMQTVLVTVRVVSSDNLKTLDLELPSVPTASLTKVDGPKAHAVESDGRREIVNELHFSVTPLASGSLDIPPVKVSGTMAATNPWRGGSATDRSFALQAQTPLSMVVRPAASADKLWLPLYGLHLKAQLDSPRGLIEGEPIMLTLEVATQGASADRVPSLGPLLESKDFRAYPEQPRIEQRISDDGFLLTGSRVERYTLVPTHGGALRLPEIRVPWWDLGTESWESSVLPERVLTVAGLGVMDTGAGAANHKPAPLGGFVAVLSLVLVGGFGSWLWVLTHPTGTSMPAGGAAAVLAAVVARVRARLAQHLALLSPLALWLRARQRAFNALPAWVRLRYRLHCLNRERDPAAWCRLLRGFLSRYLDPSVRNRPFSAVAEAILRRAPSLDPGAMRTLVRQLNGVLYGTETLDFRTWKSAFRKQLRPVLHGRRRRRFTRRGASYLPNLNPGAR